MVGAGDLNTLVTLLAPTITRDSHGGEIVTWVEMGQVWAKVSCQTGKEFFSSQKKQNELVYEVKLRYRRDIKATWRITTNGRILEVLAVLPSIEKDILILGCREYG